MQRHFRRRVVLVRNRKMLAYVVTLGVGLEIVELNSFLNEEDFPTSVVSNVLSIYSGLDDPSLEICDLPFSATPHNS